MLAALLTASVLTPFVPVRFGYRNPSLHLVLDTVDACIALLLAYLLQGRYSRGRRLQDALLADGLLLLGVAGLGLTLALGLVRAVVPEAVGVWLPLVLRLVAAIIIVVAACVGDRPMPTDLRTRIRLVPWVAIGVAMPLLWWARDSLPVALEQTSPRAATPVLTGHPALLSAHALSGLAFTLAAVLFTVQATKRRDPLLVWLGPAFTLAAFSRVNYVLFPSQYTGWLFTGDLLRTGSYAVLLIGAASEIQRYWSAQARAAVLEDRRRLARELHDGVVQELAYIRAEAISAELPAAERIVEACDRGLDEARAAVDALGSAVDEPLGYVLHRAARQVAERYGAKVVVEVDDTIEASQEQRHALVRIAREAVSNAVRHGRAQCTRIVLSGENGRSSLVVSDDGIGFVPTHLRETTGFGLVSMRERARALPGSFDVSSAPGRGTKVVVTW